MYKLRGEDAIINFPGADKSVIKDRDVYMARALRSAAKGTPSHFEINLRSQTRKQCSIALHSLDLGPCGKAGTVCTSEIWCWATMQNR